MFGDLPNEADSSEESDNESLEELDFDCEDEDMSTYESSDHSDTESDVESDTEEASRFLATDGNLRTEPKFISFLVQILLLFKFCHFCKSDNPNIKATKCGTMLIVRSHCINPACLKEDLWRSQPKMTGTNIPAGNFLLYSDAYEKVCKALTKPGFLKGIKKLSNDAQTSCLEDYVEDIYQTILNGIKSPTMLQDAINELKDQTPPPMNSTLEKQPRILAVEKHTARKSLVATDVPPTMPGRQGNSFVSKATVYQPREGSV
eukprot:gene17912-biopygen685